MRSCALIALALLVSAPLRADEYGVEEDRSVWLRALLDLRLVRAGAAPSWMDRGPGLTRYGGVEQNGRDERVTRFAISQLALESVDAAPEA